MSMSNSWEKGKGKKKKKNTGRNGVIDGDGGIGRPLFA
jgi:hypothetical protein